jgi:lipid-A-disaccharide synthase
VTVPRLAETSATVTATAPPNVYVSAGEPSGDEYGAELVNALHRLEPGLTCTGMGGTALREAGADLHTDIDGLTAMGLAEVVTKLPAHHRALNAAVDQAKARPPDVAVLIDYPSFHLRIARKLKKLNVGLIQFVAPKFWAWRPSRSQAYRDVIDHFATIFPFEPDFLNKLGIESTFVGHPVMDLPIPTRQEARLRLGVGLDKQVLSVFPGSRGHEVRRMWPVFRSAIRRVREAMPNLEVLVAAVSGESYPESGDCLIILDASQHVMAAGDALLGKSGTSNLLAARLGVPMVIAHAVHPITYGIARRWVQTPHISPINILAKRSLVPELIQASANPELIAKEVLEVLEDSAVRTRQISAFEEITDSLGPFGAAGRVAEMAIERCRNR